MLTDELKDRGRQLVQELGLEPSDTTGKWMAHYIAELMYEAENADSAEERSQAANRCADVILQLWRRRSEKASRYVRSQVYSSLETIYGKREPADLLRTVLETPSEQTYPRDWDTRSIILWHLTEVERDLLRLLIIANAVDEREKGGAVDDALEEFIETEDRISVIRRHLNDVFPGIGDLDIRKRRSVIRRVKSGLKSIHATREHLI